MTAEPHVVPLWSSLEEAIEQALRLPEPPESRWHRAGVSARGERIFDMMSGLVLVLFTVGWTWSIADARTTDGGSAVTAATASMLARCSSLTVTVMSAMT